MILTSLILTGLLPFDFAQGKLPRNDIFLTIQQFNSLIIYLNSHIRSIRIAFSYSYLTSLPLSSPPYKTLFPVYCHVFLQEFV